MMIYVIIDSRWVIDKQLVNLSAVAVVSNMLVVPASHNTVKKILFSPIRPQKYFFTRPKIGSSHKNPDILKPFDLHSFKDFYSDSHNCNPTQQ